MKLEVMRLKTKNNMNFQPEQTMTDQSTLIKLFVKNIKGRRGGGGGGVGGLMENLRYTQVFKTLIHFSGTNNMLGSGTQCFSFSLISEINKVAETFGYDF